jgi:hypothetical protein
MNEEKEKELESIIQQMQAHQEAGGVLSSNTKVILLLHEKLLEMSTRLTKVESLPKSTEKT